MRNTFKKDDACHEEFCWVQLSWQSGNMHQHHHIHGGSLLLLQQNIQSSLTCDAALQGQENEATGPDPGPWPQEICLRDCVCSSQQRRQHPQRSLLLHLVADSNPEAAEGEWSHSMTCSDDNAGLQSRACRSIGFQRHWYCRCKRLAHAKPPKAGNNSMHNGQGAWQLDALEWCTRTH